MNFLQAFHNYLEHTDTSSRATVKNYMADVRKFITWFEWNYKRSFLPNNVNRTVLDTYRNYLLSGIAGKNHSTASFSSYKRYLSSLKKFFTFLYARNEIQQNPFTSTTMPRNEPLDPWYIKDFRNSLELTHLRHHSIKNYINDIQQFIRWYKTVALGNTHVADEQILSGLSDTVLETYKNRLFQEAQYSPLSVNRKLSALRKYFSWVSAKKIINLSPTVTNLTNSLKAELANEMISLPKNEDLSVFITHNQDMYKSEYKKVLKQKKRYIGPVRFTLGIYKLINYLLDLLIIIPLTAFIATTGYDIWKAQGRKIFSPVQQIFGVKQKRTFPDYKSKTGFGSSKNIQSRTSRLLAALERFIQTGNYKKIKNVHNLPKAVYAPLAISTKSYPWYKKLLYHLRYSRPMWYKRYRSHPLVPYLHVAVLLILTVLAGILLTRKFGNHTATQPSVLAAFAQTSPRILGYQGRLTDSRDDPITTPTTLRFAMYNDLTASGSALLWQEVQTVTPNQNGNFSIKLGTRRPIDPQIFIANPDIYLGITIGMNNELQPRQQLPTVNYTANAQTVEGLTPITQPHAGVKNVILALDSSGNLTIGGLASPTFAATGGQMTLSGQILNLTTEADSNTNITIDPDGSGIIDLEKPLQNTTNNNNLAGARGDVEVDDGLAILATSSGQPALLINQDSTGNLLSASTSGIAKFTLDYLGNGTFAGNLGINGDALTTTATSFNLLTEKVINLNLGTTASSISIGSSNGITSINNNLTIAKLATFTGGALVPTDQSLSVNGFVGSDLIPLVTGVYNLGSATNHWNNAYIDNIFTSPNATASGFWQRTSAGISPLTPSDNLLVGSGSNSSAPFEIFANSFTNGTRTIPGGTASTSGQLSFTTSSQINLLNAGSLGFYTSAGGDNGLANIPALSISRSGSVGIGTANPAAVLDVQSQSTSNPLAIFTGNTSATGLSITNNGSGNLFSVQNSTGNQFLIASNGNVGIGNPLPSFKLDVQDTQTATAAAQIYNNSTSASADGLIVKLGNNSTTIPNSNHFVNFETAGIGIVGSIQGNGSDGISFVQNGVADFAEYLKKDSEEPILYGSLVCLNQDGNAVLCDQTDTDLIGVASEHPAFLGGQNLGNGSIAVGLSGVVSTSVSNQNGTIIPGDLISASAIPGVGIKATKAGLIVGRALERFDGSGASPCNNDVQESQTPTGQAPVLCGKIMVVVTVGWFAPDETITQSGNVSHQIIPANQSSQQANLSQFMGQTLQTIQLGAVTAGQLAVNSLSVSSDNITIGTETLKQYITDTITQILQNTANTIVENQIVSPLASVDQLKTNIISPLADDSNISLKFSDTKVSILNTQDASGSAVASFDNQGNATISGTLAANTLQANNATIAGTLRVSRLSADTIDGLDAKLATLAAGINQNTTNIGNLSLNRSNTISTMTASPSATAYNNGIAANESAPTEQMPTEPMDLLSSSSIATNYAPLASISAQLTTVPNLKTDFATINQGLMVFGSTSLNDVSVAGQLAIGNNFFLNQDSLNTIGSDLALQPLRQGNLSIMAGLIQIDTDGNLSVSGNATFAKNLTVKGTLAAGIINPLADSDLIMQLNNNQASDAAMRVPSDPRLLIRNASGSGVLSINQIGDVVASGAGQFNQIIAQGLQIVRGAQADTSITETVASGSAGTATVTAYQTQRTILSPYVSAHSLIYITPTSDTAGIIPYISRQTPANTANQSDGSFTIEIPRPTTQPITLNWWIVN